MCIGSLLSRFIDCCQSDSCPAGRYGNVAGLVTSECSLQCKGANDVGEVVCNVHGVSAFPRSYLCLAGDAALCEEGYYCPLGSISSTQLW